jgi:hypothetical protein
VLHATPSLRPFLRLTILKFRAPVTPDELRKIGIGLYGEDWKPRLAKAMPCTERSINHWLAGTRKIMPMVEARIRSLAIGQTGGQS